MDWIKIRNNSDKPELISARSVQFTIGFLGFIFPLLLIVVAAVFSNCQNVQNSISAYYHTISRNVFVGVLCAISLSLFAYRGYSRVDNLVGNLAAASALGVAFFPTSLDAPFTPCLPTVFDNGMVSTFHFLSAAVLFVCFSFFSLLLFTKSKGTKSKVKIIKNRIYRTCGFIMLACIGLIAIYFGFQEKLIQSLEKLRPVFWLESLALWAFSISWLTKSEYFHREE